MKELNTYIIEKLRINKNVKIIDDDKYNVKFHIWFSSDDIYRVRDYINEKCNVNRFSIEITKEKDKDFTLYKIGVENKEDFTQIVVLVIKLLYTFNDLKKDFNIKDIETERWEIILNNYKELKDLIYTLDNKDIYNKYYEDIE